MRVVLAVVGGVVEGDWDFGVVDVGECHVR